MLFGVIIIITYASLHSIVVDRPLWIYSAKYTCDEYGSCFNTTILSSTSNEICHGARSCIYSSVDTGDYDLFCNGYGSCYHVTVNTTDTWCHGGDSCSYSNIIGYEEITCIGMNTCCNSEIKLTSTKTPILYCRGFDSCSNMIYKSDTSWFHTSQLNQRFITIFFKGVFNGYNTSIYSNGNGVMICIFHQMVIIVCMD